ncbi:LPS-assembly protein LptD [Hyphomicrobium sp. 99]|uniref:LPS-assembly protein LptD n=1 Tax=Hyphomicrobium sp. 99 TaxID=1163419 RepID=UPI0005F7A2A2|nr:LPS-assembly protein LptD [Hyphomicrobium sp. 99]
MREARTPQEGCGPFREGSRRLKGRGAARALLRLVLIGCVATISSLAHAQVSDLNNSKKTQSSFGAANSPSAIFGKVSTNIDRAQPMRLQGDQLIYDKSGDRVISRGNVEIFYNNYILTADEVVYDQSGGTLTAVGNVTLKEPQGNIVHADRYTLTDDFRDGFVSALSIVSADKSHISADRATRREGNITEFENGKFTPCQSDGNTPPLWCISAARIIHDQEAATLTYQDAYFQIYGQPILYLPYFQSPDPSVKRKTGFLTPDYGHSSTLGYITGIPYFFNLAPNYDVTLEPLYMSEQGLFMKGEWRHRLANGEYTVKLAGIDQDAANLPGGANANNNAKLDGFRGSVETHGLFSLSSWWKFGWDAIVESDDQFRRFYKLDSVLVTDRVNQVYLTGQSDRNYFNATLYQFGGLLTNDTPETESYTHPIINYNYVFADPVLGGELKWNTNVLSFTRTDGTVVDPLTGRQQDQNINRIITELNWRRRFTDAIGISYTPFADIRGDVYQYDNVVDPTSVTLIQPEPATGPAVDPTTTRIIGNETVTRGIVDGGVLVSYPWVANSSVGTHIVEPIGQIVTHQESLPQRRLPNEDAQSLVFDDTNLFATTKFSGYDRIETGTRVNAGLQYTFQANDGGYARFLAGQSYQLSGDNAYLLPGRTGEGNFVFNPLNGLETQKSDYVLGAYFAPIADFRIISQSRFNESTLALKREDLAAVAKYGPLSVQAGYSYDADALFTDPDNPDKIATLTRLEEVLGSATLQLTNRWSVGGSTRYDLESGNFRYDSVNLKYADECFVLTASYIQSNYSDLSIEPDQTVMLRFEFKHLGDFAATTGNLDFNMGGDQRTN